MNFSLKVKKLTSGQPITLCFVFPKIVDIHILRKNNDSKKTLDCLSGNFQIIIIALGILHNDYFPSISY